MAMNQKLYFSIIVLTLFLATMGAAQATREVWLKVTDKSGNSIKNKPVPINTVAHVTGYYEDENGKEGALANMTVWYKKDPNNTWKYIESLFAGFINSGTTIERNYTLTQLGYYQFRWIVSNMDDSAEVQTKVGPVYPEPSTLAALGVSLLALGIMFTRKRLFT